MSAREMSLAEMIAGGLALGRYLLLGGLFNINLEVTKRCNARCGFCNYWQEPPILEMKDYVPIVGKLKPLSVSLTGGEPLLRKDLVEIIRSLRRSFDFIHISLITNGALLTVDRGLALWNAGLDELSISLDYPDRRHDAERKIDGLSEHILKVAPRLAEQGVNLCFNTVIKRGNLDHLVAFSRQVHAMGIKQSFSCYNGWRIGNWDHSIRKEEYHQLVRVTKQLRALREELGHIGTGDYYLDRIPEFFSNGGIPGCTAGLNWVQVTPDGQIKRCSDFPPACHWSDWKPTEFSATDCTKCWYSCRGAAQERLGIKRLVEMAREAFE